MPFGVVQQLFDGLYGGHAVAIGYQLMPRKVS